MKGFFSKKQGAEKQKATFLRDKYVLMQKEILREAISQKLASLKDEVNVEKILADLADQYVMRSDFDSVRLQTNVDMDPVLVLRFSHESTGLRETTDRLVPLANYATA